MAEVRGIGFEGGLVLAGTLLAGAVLLGKLSIRHGLPAMVAFLLVGMLAGADGPGGIDFSDDLLSQRFAFVALAYILFAGGLETSWREVRPTLGPALRLATVGVIVTAGIVAVAARLFAGVGWIEAWLLGAIVAPTDAGAVFAVLRGRNLGLRPEVGHLLELESGANDPVAVFLTIALTEWALTSRAPTPGGVALELAREAGFGVLVGLGVGRAAGWIARRAPSESPGLLPVLSAAWPPIAFGGAMMLHGSGFVAVYLAGIVYGACPLPRRKQLEEFHDGLAWLMQVALFLVLGLLVYPSRMTPVAGFGLTAAAVGILVARPVAVHLSLLGTPFTRAERTFVAWTGLRGSVPIVLATIPALADLPQSDELFHLVFFVVLVSALVQGPLLPWVARRLRLA